MRAVGEGPSRADIQAIETEWPLIEAEMSVVDAEVAIARADEITELDQRRLRRATAQVTRQMQSLYHTSPAPLGGAA
jgi:hypothetical protein